MKPKILRFFPDTDLRCNQNGLSKIAKASGKPVSSLKKGEFFIFVNRTQTQLKMLTGSGLLLNQRAHNNAKISFEAVKDLPNHFDGQSFDYTKAVEKAIKKKLERKRKG